MTAPLTPEETLREEYYRNQAKAEIRATVARRAENKGLLKHGIGWSLYMALLFAILNYFIPAPFLSAWLYLFALFPLVLTAVVRFLGRESVSPEVEAEEVRLAEVFAKEEEARKEHYRQQVLDEYRPPAN